MASGIYKGRGQNQTSPYAVWRRQGARAASQRNPILLGGNSIIKHICRWHKALNPKELKLIYGEITQLYWMRTKKTKRATSSKKNQKTWKNPQQDNQRHQNTYTIFWNYTSCKEGCWPNCIRKFNKLSDTSTRTQFARLDKTFREKRLRIFERNGGDSVRRKQKTYDGRQRTEER